MSGWRGFFQGEWRRALANFGWLVGEKALRLGVGFLVTAWLARYLGPAEFGILSYTLAVIGLLMFIPVLGLDEIVKRDVLRAPETTRQLLGTAFRLRLAAAGMVMVGLMVMVLVLKPANPVESRLLLVLGGLLFQPALLVPELYFQATAKARYATWAQLGALFTGAALRLMLIQLESGLLWFGVVVLVELTVVAMLQAWWARRDAGCAGWWRAWDGARALELLKAGWPLMLAGAAVVLYMRIDQVMLRHLAGEEEAGIYAVAVRLSEVVYFVPAIVVTGLLPFWSAARQRGGCDYEHALQGIFDLLTALALGFALLVTLFSGAIVSTVFGPDYVAAGPVLAVHVWAGIFVFQGTVRSQAWVFEDWNRLLLVTTVVGAACNLLLNYLWIPRHGALGAAAATLVAYGVAAWGTSFCFRRTRPMAWQQTKALLLPVLGWRYLFRRSSHAGPL